MFLLTDFFNELEAELKPLKRWSFWSDRLDAARAVHKGNEAAFDDQTRELEIAVELLEELGQAHEYRCRAYPTLYKRIK